MGNSFFCRLCSHDCCEPLFTAGDINRHINDEPFHYFRCPQCGSIQLRNIPKDLGPYYGNNYYSLPANAEELLNTVKHDRYKLDIVLKHIKSGRLLEIGPGAGGFAYVSKLEGFDVSVIELDEKCRRFIDRELGITVLDQPETLSGDSSGEFDIIAMWHVLEHLPDVATLLENLAYQLRPGGFLILALPNPESIQFRLFGKYWVHLDAPRHVNLFPAASLVAALDKRHFSLTWSSKSDLCTQFWNRFGWIKSCENLPVPRILRPLMRLVGYTMATVSYFLGKSDFSRSAYTLVLRRDQL